MPLIFGSPEAADILRRDKQLASLDNIDAEWYEDTTSKIDDLREQIDALEAEIEQIDALEAEIEQIEDQIVALEDSPCPLTDQTYRAIHDAKKAAHA